MKEQNKSNKKDLDRSRKSFDPSGSYTGSYYRLDEDEVSFTSPEQDADDL